MSRPCSLVICSFVAFLLQTAGTYGGMLDLGVLPGHDYSNATAINDLGQIVGWSSGGSRGDVRAFYYDGGSLVDMGTPEGDTSSLATDINNRGIAVGVSYAGSSYRQHAVVWDNGIPRAIGSLPGFDYSVAMSINDGGQIAGYSFNGNWNSEGGLLDFGVTRSFVYDPNTQVFTDLGSLGGQKVEVQCINNLGQVVGSSTDSDGTYHAFLWDSTNGMQDIGSWVPTSINSEGQIVGGYSDTQGRWYATIWQNGTMSDLEQLKTSGSGASAINDLGAVVGDTYSSAFLWDNGNETNLTELFSSVGVVNSANDINYYGQIVGNGGLHTSTGIHAILLTADGTGGNAGVVPEPAFFQLGALLIMGGAALRRRR